MRKPRQALPAGFVKVEIRSHSPRRWGWSVLNATGVNPIVQSRDLFRSAEDAWRCGQAALDALPPEKWRDGAEA